MVIGLNIGVLGLFSLESVTMAELFGSRTRFTQLALAKEIGGILATAIGPVVAATLTAVTGSWWPIAAMLVVYSLITLVSGVPRSRDPRPRPGPAGGRGMKAVVVHGAGDLRVDERPDPAPGPGEVLDRDGVGRDLRIRPGLLAQRLVRHRRAAATRWSSGTSSPAASPQLGAGVTGLRGRAPGHRAPGRAGRRRVPAGPARRPHQPLPADPLLRLRGVRPAHRRRIQRAEGGSGRPDPPAARGCRHRARRAGRAARRRAARGAPGRGRAGRDVARQRRRARSARWWSPRRSTAGAAIVVAADLADSSLAVARAMGADEVRNLAAGDTLPEDAELVFEASGAPAALGGVLRATARGGTLVQVGNLPGTAGSAVLGDLVTREITWIGAYRFVEEISDALVAHARRPRRVAADHPPVQIDQAEKALAVAGGPDQRQQQGHAAAAR